MFYRTVALWKVWHREIAWFLLVDEHSFFIWLVFILDLLFLTLKIMFGRRIFFIFRYRNRKFQRQFYRLLFHMWKITDYVWCWSESRWYFQTFFEFFFLYNGHRLFISFLFFIWSGTSWHRSSTFRWCWSHI